MDKTDLTCIYQYSTTVRRKKNNIKLCYYCYCTLIFYTSTTFLLRHSCSFDLALSAVAYVQWREFEFPVHCASRPALLPVTVPLFPLMRAETLACLDRCQTLRWRLERRAKPEERNAAAPTVTLMRLCCLQTRLIDMFSYRCRSKNVLDEINLCLSASFAFMFRRRVWIQQRNICVFNIKYIR